MTACDAPVPLPELVEVVERAEAAYAALDEPAFLLEVDTLSVRVPCLAETLPPAWSARVHRVFAVRLFGEQPERSLASVAAARSADGALELPWIRPPHPLAEAWAAPPDPATVRLPRPKGDGALWIDGVPTRERPVARAAVVQWEEGAEVRSTTLLFPDDPVPAYAHVSPLRRGLAVGAGGATAAAIGAWAGAMAARSAFGAPDHDLAELERLQTTANALTLGSLGLLATGGGLLVGSLVVDRG